MPHTQPNQAKDTIWDGPEAPTKENMPKKEKHQHDDLIEGLAEVLGDCEMYKQALISVRNSINEILGE